MCSVENDAIPPEVDELQSYVVPDDELETLALAR